jgi:pimeloyl-ACP methyl ester carboxylesterase
MAAESTDRRTCRPTCANVTLTDCGHLPMWDDPEAVAQVQPEGSALAAGVS